MHNNYYELVAVQHTIQMLTQVMFIMMCVFCFKEMCSHTNWSSLCCKSYKQKVNKSTFCLRLSDFRLISMLHSIGLICWPQEIRSTRSKSVPENGDLMCPALKFNKLVDLEKSVATTHFWADKSVHVTNKPFSAYLFDKVIIL